MRSLALLLHFYQPPTQSTAVTEQVLRSCYLPLADLLLSHPEAGFTLNIAIPPAPDFTAKIRLLLDRGQIELTNSPIYHPLLPLLDATEIGPLLEANKQLLKDTFGVDPVDLVYPPELAVKPEIYRPNMIIDESSVKSANHPLVSRRAVTEILRSYPKELTAEIFLKFLDKQYNNVGANHDSPLLAATDAEIFGHHYTERINLLRELLESEHIKFTKIPSAKTAPLQIKPSSWQTTDPKNPYPLWLANDLQKKYDELARMTYHLLQKSPDPNPPAESHYRRGISSCHYYWLSNWPWWHPDLVESGGHELIRCVRGLYIDTDQKIPAEKLYHDFLMQMWSYHWSGEVEKKWQEYNQFREKFLRESFGG